MSSIGSMQESILPVCDKPLYKIKENIPHWEELNICGTVHLPTSSYEMCS